MKVIGYPPIVSDPSWNSSNITLGDAVYAVIHHFQLNPPNVMEILDVNLKRLQESLSGGGGTKNNSAASSAATMPASYQQSVANGSSPLQNGMTNEKQSQRQQQHEEAAVTDDEVNTLIPSIPASFPQLQSMTMSEIKHLLNNESAFESFIQRTPEVITLNEIKQSIVDANVGTAQSNILQYKEKVDRQSIDITTLEKELSSKLSKYETLNIDRERICRPPDGKETVKELNRAKKEAYRNSETIADDWVESGDNIHEFVEKFMEERILYHTRAAKAERLSL
eukprot:scaffold21538_cov41-Cyclotella_meneghiniana.AAC.11